MNVCHDDHFTIVMIEDDEGHARLIEKNLRRSGISNTMVHLNDGDKAMQYFFAPEMAHIKHDRVLILLDLNLPTIDGYEILARLKSEDRTHAIPTIILTTTDNPKEVDRCYELGCNVYITKPVEYDSFSDAIQKVGLMLSIVKIPHHTK